MTDIKTFSEQLSKLSVKDIKTMAAQLRSECSIDLKSVTNSIAKEKRKSLQEQKNLELLLKKRQFYAPVTIGRIRNKKTH